MTTATTDKPWPPGYRINPRVEALPPDLIEAFRSVPTAHASDSLGRNIGAMDLRAYHRSLALTMCGPALTVRVRPGDNLMVHKAMAMAQPGDVIVIDGAGDLTQAVIGGLIRTTAIQRQLGGFVIDGVIRDVAEWVQGVIPIYARGNVHRGPTKDGPGMINIPIACAGMAVSPGDLVLGDADSVIVVPAADVAALLRVRAHTKKEDAIRAMNAAGTIDPERFDAPLRAKGCPI
jgi:regulator of RNase E activity RraA